MRIHLDLLQGVTTQQLRSAYYKTGHQSTSQNAITSGTITSIRFGFEPS